MCERGERQSRPFPFFFFFGGDVLCWLFCLHSHPLSLLYLSCSHDVYYFAVYLVAMWLCVLFNEWQCVKFRSKSNWFFFFLPLHLSPGLKPFPFFCFSFLTTTHQKIVFPWKTKKASSVNSESTRKNNAVAQFRFRSINTKSINCNVVTPLRVLNKKIISFCLF